ncbi:formate dehydrogenase accessory sulfurtransferase FdhD [Wenxinia marina]|uniref:Sulfur carrier protein FdhD n=1 Tax=Wenxinia marina DSM 24838 TaxID=1123501 RepID=A0A0D0NKK4_9RHOB|nr:formate dehydrogenase accessory sulfurtransferase FdhD [Wenxinia marina]KIQ68855.1 formate dehydrogenase family accessory protein FdhD [Wenxinia marina DSM 24838]GGL64705.1 sulfurtransferase FdhD [Wenxinia marina]
MRLEGVRLTPALGPAGPEERALPEETPVALVYNGSTYAVMMASPADLTDFAIGFTLSEAIATANEVGEVEVVAHEHGIEARMWLPEGREAALASRRRAVAGPVGCGLCGIDSLAAAVRPLPRVAEPDWRFPLAEVGAALESLRGHQPLHDATRAVHAAGFWQPGRGIVMAREDVGRHNALDKLIGALARAGIDGASGAVVLTSRVSVEMVQKAATLGAPVVVAVSSPTAHAVRLADGAGVTLVSAAGRQTRIFTHPQRVNG